MKSLSNDQLAGLSPRQIKKADGFIDALSKKQVRFLSSFNPSDNELVESEEFRLSPVIDPLA